MMSRWGEIPMDTDTEPGIAAIEREQITKPRPMELEGPLLHQPSVKVEQPDASSVPFECTFGDPLITHSIALNQHAKKLRTMISNLQQQLENPQKQGESEDGMQFFTASPVLECSEKETVRNNNNMTLFSCFSSKFRQGIGEMPPEINEQLAKKILHKAIAVMCAHTGFETTTESILDILVDVIHEFYLKLTHLLRANVDRRELMRGTSFPDVLEQVFYDMGIGSMHNLGEFYRTRVIKYHDHLMQVCKQADAEYKKLKCPDVIKPKEEPNATNLNEDSVPQISFPVTDEHDETNQPETGLHLDELPNLQVTFEQETGVPVEGEDECTNKLDQATRADLLLALPTTSMTNLDADEEIVNVIDSPVQGNDSDLAQEPNLSTMLDQQQSPIMGIGMKVLKSKKKM